MRGKARFLKSIIAAAEAHEGSMPWSRGAARAAFIARRRNGQALRRSA
jgi:hypothetical protein